ncbi:MAG: response regulator [Ruminococcus sp.]|nr:response regulator [Ruminococcus sp.]
MKILIIDDEKTFAENLRVFVEKVFSEMHTVLEITVTDDSKFVLYNSKQYDVILLDIEMPDCSGIKLASKLNEKNSNDDKPHIIFVTNRDELVFDALKQQPFSFVRKSHLDDLELCLHRLIKLSKKKSTILLNQVVIMSV